MIKTYWIVSKGNTLWKKFDKLGPAMKFYTTIKDATLYYKEEGKKKVMVKEHD